MSSESIVLIVYLFCAIVTFIVAYKIKTSEDKVQDSLVCAVFWPVVAPCFFILIACSAIEAVLSNKEKIEKEIRKLNKELDDWRESWNRIYKFKELYEKLYTDYQDLNDRYNAIGNVDMRLKNLKKAKKELAEAKAEFEKDRKYTEKETLIYKQILGSLLKIQDCNLLKEFKKDE